MPAMNAKIKLGLQLFAIVMLSVSIAFVARNGFAWTSPTGNPPFGSATLTASGGNIGIGTATPGAPLQVNSATGGAIRLQYTGNSGYGQMETNGGNDLIFKTSGGAGTNIRMTILEASGNVGIGTTAPSAGLKLDVEGKVGATEYCDQNGSNCKVITAMGGPSYTIVYSAGGSNNQSVTCPSGYIIIGGSCDWYSDGDNYWNTARSYHSGNAWFCNTTDANRLVRAVAFCSY